MSAVDGVAALQKTLLAALDQMGAAISELLHANPDMVFMHQSPGLPIDPKEYEDPWTPDGGDIYAIMADNGEIKIPPTTLPPPVTPGTSTTPPTSKPTPPPPPDPHAAAGINSAVNTAHLANQNLQLGSSIAAYGLGTVADAWGLIAGGAEAPPPPPPAPEVLAAIKKAMDVLYVRPGVPTQGYRDFKASRNTLIGVLGQKPSEFVTAMGDPAAAAAWPLGRGRVLDQMIRDAQTDLDAVDLSGDGMSYTDAETFIRAQGQDIVTAAVDALKMRWTLFGQASAAVGQFSYTTIDPPSWSQSTDDEFGAMTISVSESTYDATSTTQFGNFSSSYYNASSSSDSGGVGIVYGPFSATGNVSYQTAKSNGGFSTGSHGGSTGWDHSSSASISGEFFMATIDRPWLYEEIFRIPSGWHIKNKPSNFISDGTNSTANNGNWMPAMPVGMLVARNLAITCDDWGQFSSFATDYAASAASHDESSATRVGGSVGAFGLGGTYNHQDSSVDGSQFHDDDGSSSWSFQSSASGGTLSIHGTQVLGWLVRVLPPAPPA